MPRGGKLTIETATEPAGDSVALIVTDTGSGMDAATRARIFEPFFTTKGAGKGTGLGLATVQRIVKQCGGSIELITEPGHGTTFRIVFPSAPKGATAHLESADGVAPRGTETVIVAEDDPSVRLLARLLLQRSGYRVLEAGTSQEEILIARDFREPIHLLLSDVIMPDTSGAPLIEQLRATRPELRVLYMSGYTDDAIVHHGVLDEGTAFLQKPFTPLALAHKIREVLDQMVSKPV
jgi:CheY-like chemotaxis protein